jgi:hypothetical protein
VTGTPTDVREAEWSKGDSGRISAMGASPEGTTAVMPRSTGRVGNLGVGARAIDGGRG